MFITFVEIKYGLLGMAIIAVAVLALLIVISGVHLLGREIGHSIRRRRARAMPPQPRTAVGKKRAYAGAGD